MENQSILKSTALDIPLSNSQEYMDELKTTAITEFNVFNPYVHYYHITAPTSTITGSVIPVTIDYRLEYV